MGHPHLHGSDRKMRPSKKPGLKRAGQKEATVAGDPSREISKWGIDARYLDSSFSIGSSQIARLKVIGEEVLDHRSSVTHQNLRSAPAKEEIKSQGRFKSQNSDTKFNYSDDPLCIRDSNTREIKPRQKTKGLSGSSTEQLKKHASGRSREKKFVTEDLIHNMSNLPDFLQRTQREDSFQDRALRFGVLDWSLLEKWNHSRSLKGKRRSFHSSSGSDTSSSLSSTMGSSSFSCRSDSSNCATTKSEASAFDYSLHKLNASPVHPLKAQHQSHSSPSPSKNHSERMARESVFRETKNNDKEFASSEFLDFKLFQGNMVKTQISSPGSREETCNCAVKGVSVPAQTLGDSIGPMNLEAAKENDMYQKKGEESAEPSCELIKEQQCGGSESSCFFSAGEGSPETCSEMSISLEDALQHLGLKAKDSWQTNLETADTHAFDYSNNLSFVIGEEITSIDASVPRELVSEPLQQVATTQDSQETVLPKNPEESLEVKEPCKPRNAFPKKAGDGSGVSKGTEPKNPRGQQPKNKAPRPLPTKPVHSSSELPKMVLKNEASIGCSSNMKRRSKSFSIGNECSLNDRRDVIFTPAKSVSIRPEKCSCQHNSGKSGCKICKRPSVSPLRKWIDPLVKSREKHRRNASLAPMELLSLHHEPDAHALRYPRTSLQKEAYLGPSVADISAAENLPKTLCSSNSSSEGHSSKAPNNQNDSSSSTHSRCNSPVCKQDQISKKPFDSKASVELNTVASSVPDNVVFQGVLHFMYKDGLPYFTFSLNDSERVFAAKTWKIDKSEGRDFDWMYSFHSGQSQGKKKHKGGWVSWGKKDFTVPAFVGKMKVSSSLSSKLNKLGSLEHMVETEFVLSGVGNENARENLGIEVADNRTFFPFQTTNKRESASDSENLTAIRNRPKKERAASRNVFRQSFSDSCKTCSVSSTATGRKDNEVKAVEPENLDIDFIASSSFCSYLELAAIIVRVPLESRESVKSGPPENMLLKKPGGWGLKFLEKISGIPTCETNSSESCPLSEWEDEDHLQSFRKSNSSPDRSLVSDSESFSISTNGLSEGNASVSVLIPAGLHGLPRSGLYGPSSLIERWRSGGECDCDGWDLGCPLTVMENSIPAKQNLQEGILEVESFHPSELYIQGTKQNRPAFSLAMIHDGLYLLGFQEPLSALQAFAIGVAMLHSREPLVSVREMDKQEACLPSSNGFPAAKQRTLSQAISAPQEDFPMNAQRNHETYSVHCLPHHPPLSPFGRV